MSQSADPAPRAHRGRLLLALGVLAVAGNVAHLPLFFGVDFAFGSVAALLAVYWLGVLPGLAVAGVGALYTLWLGDHPYAVLPVVSEAGAVGLILRRRPPPVSPPLALADGLFWLVLGMPLAVLLLHGPLQMSWSRSGLVALELSTNGLLNAALAGVVVILSKRLRHRQASISLREVLVSTLLLAALVPTIALTAIQHHGVRDQRAALLRAAPGRPGLPRSVGTALVLLALISLAATLGADHLSRCIARHTAAERRRVEAERDTAAGALRRYNTDLKAFSDLMAAYRPPHEQIRALLDFACRSLGAQAAALGELQGASYRLLTSFGTAGSGLGPHLAPGMVLTLGSADQAAIADLARVEAAAPSAPRDRPRSCALPPQSGFVAAALLHWTDAEGRAHQGALSFAPDQGVTTTEKLQVIQLVGQGVASSLRERAVLDGLLAARQREIIGHLASGVAHDFNNLLGVVDINLDYLATLLGTGEWPAEVGEVLEETRLAARHAQMVTTGLLSLSRGRRLATRPTPVAAVVERFTRTLARILPARIEVKTAITPGLVAQADEALLQAALLNLCINARDAMGGRGTLEIGVTQARLTTRRALTLGYLDPGEYVELAVADTGVGMSAEVLGRIFEPLFSTKSSGRGTGLGLFMVREFVERCGGGVGVETRPGRGSRFTVYLPVATALPVAASDQAAAPLPPLSARVLVVDDDPGIRTVLCRTLERRGLQVEQAVDGADALARLAGSPPCDLVLSDIVMPRMDGIELHRRLAQTAPGLPVILMTADEHQSVQAAGLPVDTVILFKPLVPEILLARIQERLVRRD